MDVNQIIQLINGVGFPIFACIAMGSYIWWDKKQRAQDREKRELRERNTLEALKETVDNNTRIIQKLYDAIMKGEDK
mgnify:FL=1